MFNIAVLDTVSDVGLRLLPGRYSIIDNPEEAHGIVIRASSMHGVPLGKNLLAVAKIGSAGVYNIPVDKCTERGIAVFNTPGLSANAVKEFALAGLFLAARNILDGSNWLRSLSGDVSGRIEQEKSRFSGSEIAGKTIGIVGLGYIGSLVAEAAACLGMKVLAYDPVRKDGQRPPASVILLESLHALLSQSDYVSLHVALSDQTKGIIGASEIAAMKAGASLLNYASSDTVNEAAVLSALQSRKIHRYVTDFPSEAMLHAENAICTPHLGSSTKEAEEQSAVAGIQQLRDYLEAGTVKNSVNFPECVSTRAQTAHKVAVFSKNTCRPETIAERLAKLGCEVRAMECASDESHSYCLFDIDREMAEKVVKDNLTLDGILFARPIS